MSVAARIDRFTSVRFHRGRPVAHSRGCECVAIHRFRCGVCGRVRGWCLGAADNMPNACDFCWRLLDTGDGQ